MWTQTWRDPELGFCMGLPLLGLPRGTGAVEDLVLAVVRSASRAGVRLRGRTAVHLGNGSAGSRLYHGGWTAVYGCCPESPDRFSWLSSNGR